MHLSIPLMNSSSVTLDHEEEVDNGSAHTQQRRRGSTAAGATTPKKGTLVSPPVGEDQSPHLSDVFQRLSSTGGWPP